MKYIITESQLDKFIFKYIDLKRFIQINKDDKIYFVNSEGDEYAQIRFDKKNGWCYIYYTLVEEISSFFSLSTEDSKKIIGLWIKHKFKISDVMVVQSYLRNEVPILMVPY